MLARTHDNVKIAGGRSHCAGIATARQANALAIARARLDAHLQRLAALDAAFAVACMAHGTVPAAAPAARTGHVELHAATFLRDDTFAVALRTFARLLDVALAVAGTADLKARYIELQLGALDRLPETYVHLIFQVRAGLGTLHGFNAAAAIEEAGENVTKPAAARAPSGLPRTLGEIAEVESAEIERHLLRVGARAATTACEWSLPRPAEAACAESAAARVGFRRCGID